MGEGEYFCASDATPIAEHTKNVVYLEDGEIARISLKNGLKLKTIGNQEKNTIYTRTRNAFRNS